MTVSCPVCFASLESLNKRYAIEDLFEMLKPVRFSSETISEHRIQGDATELFKCAQCGLEIFLPPIIATPRFYVEAYKLESGRQSGDFSYSEDKWDFGEAAKDLRRDSSILEIGCGPGNFLDKAKSLVKDTVGAEFNASALDAAQRKGHRVFDLAALPGELRGRFDSVFSFHVLEHVRDPIAFLAEIGSWVRPGGLVGISLPNQDGPIRLIEPCIQNMPPHHATRWRKSTFEAAARRLGWSIERVAYEPLTAQNSYYYSAYIGPHLFSGKGRAHRAARRISAALIARLLKVLFSVLAVFGCTSTSLLKGQAMYVAMRK